MIEKLVCGGQTGVDRAALDAALELGLPCGGWCPQGRLAEDGVLPPQYPLQETPSSDYAQRTEWNVRDSDGTLVLTNGPPSGGTAHTIEVAARLGKPHLVLELAQQPPPEAAAAWALGQGITVLNVAGPRESKSPGIYARASVFLRRLVTISRAGVGKTR